ERARQGQDLTAIETIAGRIVGRAQEDQAQLPRGERRRAQRWHVGRPVLLALQWLLDDLRALDARGHGVHAEGRRADQYRILTGATVAAYQQIDRLIAAAAHQQLLCRHTVEVGERG